MGIMDFFTAVPTISAAEAQRLLGEHGLEQCNLIDVRQPKEYAEHHLPGAKLIPLSELKDRLAEIDPAKPTIAY
ncbi:MAG: rhodanese-like domain-containing protein [Desulfobulbaceae bacterium]|nr:rhodanese-like domain-containing protein [Desulfobulbaceae bacterium]